MNKPLPHYPSELLRLALNDISEIEYDDRYKIDTDVWYEYDEYKNISSVNLAGVVMANTLKFNIKTVVSYDFSSVQGVIGKDNIKKLKTIEGLRLLDLYDVYSEYKNSLTDKEKTLIKKCYESIGKKLKEYTDNPDMDVDEEDIIEFKNFYDAYNFYSSIIGDLAYLDEKILGRTA